MGELDNTEGKRVLPSKKLPLGAKIGIIAGAAILALLVGGYFGLCAYVSGGDTILPHTTAAGVELGGLDRQQASARLALESGSRFGGLRTFSYPGGIGEVPGGSVELDVSAAVDTAYRLGRENGFVGGGWAYITAFFGGNDVEATIHFSQEGERAVDEAVAEIEDHLTQRVEDTTWKLRDNALALVKGVSGMGVAAADLKAEILAAFRDGKGQNGESAFTVEPQITAPEEPDFDAIYAEIHIEKADAYLDKETKEIVPSVTGITFDIPTAQALLERTEEGAVCEVPLTKTEPEMTTEKLTANLFKDTLGSTKTRAAGPAERRYNIKLACSFVNDTILLPGEEFSYNNTCQPYTLGNGYKNAGTYQNGKSVDATAGGICQLSSTLYWATLEANLETVERHQHGMDGGYMSILGTDAVVWGGGQDLRFKNDTEYPIKIEAYMDENFNVYVNIYGTSNGLHGEPFNKLISTVPAQTLYEPNASIPQGAAPQKDPQRYALKGSTVEVYLRVVDKDGNTVDTKFLHKDSYAKRDAVYFYNPTDAALWGIDPATKLKTLTPVTPTPSQDPGATTDPGVTPAPGTDPAVTPAPSTDPGTVPGSGTDSSVTEVPSPTPTPSETPAATGSTSPPGMPDD